MMDQSSTADDIPRNWTYLRNGACGNGVQTTTSAAVPMQNTASHNVRIAIVGPPSVGKSALVVRFLTKRFIGEYSSLKDQTYVKRMDIGGSSILMHIVDSCRIRNSTDWPWLEGLINRSDGILVVFSLADLDSFHAATALLQELGQRQNTPPFVFVANKADLFHLRCLDYRWGLEVAAAVGCPYLEVSAADGLSEVDVAFCSIARMAVVNKTRKTCSNPLCLFLLWWRKISRKKPDSRESTKIKS